MNLASIQVPPQLSVLYNAQVLEIMLLIPTTFIYIRTAISILTIVCVSRGFYLFGMLLEEKMKNIFKQKNFETNGYRT